MTDRSTGRGDTATRRTSVRAVTVALVVLGGLALLAGPATAQSTGETVVANDSTVPDDVIESQPDSPEEDRLGWENGVWYNATLAIDQSDGIQEAELRALVARTMARTERVRGQEFERTVPVRLISREQAQNESPSVAELAESKRLALNAQYEALFLINESTDALDSREALLGSGVGGYYAPSRQAITMVSPDDDQLRVKENTLAQELYHAQQDRRFGISGRNDSIEGRNAYRSVVEGDANYVQYRYEQRCEGTWEGTCYIPGEKETTAAEEIPDDLNIGMVQIFLQPYSSGVGFVRDRHQSQGWEAVDALYENPPESTEQVIHPEKYPGEDPANLTVQDRSTDGWEPLTADGNRVNASAGEAGLFVSLWYPSFDSQRQVEIIPYTSHINLNRTTGQIERPVSYQYDHPATAGWSGDRLLPYVTENSSGEEMGYVYETSWDSADDAREFEQAYRELLDYHDAENVSGHADTYRLPEESGFGDAVYVDRTDSRVTIVNAPTVEELSEIRPSAAPQVEGNDTDTNGSDATTERASPMEGTERTSGGESGPGFGLTAALLAFVTVVATLVVRSRR